MDDVKEFKKMNVTFKPRNQKLVLVTSMKNGDLKLEKFQGLDKKGEATVEITEETTAEGISEVIEEFRAM